VGAFLVNAQIDHERMHFFWTIIFNTGIGRVCGGLNDHIVMKTHELDSLLMESVDLERRQPRRLFRMSGAPSRSAHVRYRGRPTTLSCRGTSARSRYA